MNVDNALSGDVNLQEFVMSQFLGRHMFITLGEVVAVHEETVDVRPMVMAVTENGEPLAHEAVFGVPVWRLQGGNSAVIMPPKVGDIGYLGVCDRDISSVKKTRKAAMPASRRTHNLADAVYLGGLLNGNPTQFVEFADQQINIVSPWKITITAPEISASASKAITLSSPQIVLDGNLQQGAGSNGGNAAFGGSVKATGEVEGNGISLSSHVHGGVKSGGDKTQKPE